MALYKVIQGKLSKGGQRYAVGDIAPLTKKQAHAYGHSRLEYLCEESQEKAAVAEEVNPPVPAAPLLRPVKRNRRRRNSK